MVPVRALPLPTELTEEADLRQMMPLAHRMVGLPRRGVAAVLLAAGLLGMAAPAGAQVTIPGAPEGIHGVAGDLKVTLNWKDPESDGGAPITGYEYRYKSMGNSYPAAWTAVPSEALGVGAGLDAYLILPNLMNGTAYTFQVRAVNSEGGGTPSEEATATPQPNNPATYQSSPILGIPRVPEAVYMRTGTFRDTDSLSLANARDERYTYQWQWIRVTGGSETEIPDAVSSGYAGPDYYTLTPADVGSQVKARVRFLDDRSNQEEWVSELFPSSGTILPAATPPPALVSNLEQTGTIAGDLATSNDLAQAFTTGTNDAGYTLTSLELRLKSTSGTTPPTVTLHSGSATGTQVATFSGLTSLTANSTDNYTFTPTATVTLSMATTYWVVAQGGSTGVAWSYTASDSEDGTPATGWSIGDSGGFRSASSTGAFNFTSSSDSYRLRVNGIIKGLVPADWSLKPTGLAAGAQFRLLFLSSSTRDATATDIATYNTFVQERAAAGHTDIRAYSAGFRVVGCTADTDARDNTATTYTSSDKGVPIYWLGGAKAADEYEDFYDGDWDDQVNDKNESGTDGPDTTRVANRPWTGCDHDGTESFFVGSSRALGRGLVRVGRPASSSQDNGPISSISAHSRTDTRPMYGLSEVFQVSTATPPATAPGAPTGLSATPSGTTRIDLSWTDPASNGGSAITGYRIEVSSDGGTSWSELVANTGSTATTYAHTGLASGATRHYRVSAINSVGTGNPSNLANATTGNTAPGAPTGLSATPSGTTRIDLSWTDPASNGGSAITGYRIEVSSDGGTSWSDLVANTGSTATTYAHTGLASGTTRHYRVSAINSVGTGNPSNLANATTGNSDPTVANPIPNRSAKVGAAFSYTFPENTFSDADPGDTLSYRVTQADGTALPAWLSFAAGTRSFSGTPQATDAGTVLVKVTARDGRGGSVSDTFTLTVGDVGDLVVNFGTDAASNPIKVRESIVPHRFMLLLSAEAPQPLTIPLVVTHRGGATEADYTGLPASVTFAADKKVAGFDIRAIPDQAREPGEGLRLDFGELPPGVRKGTWGPYETIEFVDEALPERTVRFGAEAYTATEGAAAAMVSIHLDAPVEVEPLEVRLRLAYGGGATAADHGSIPTVVPFAVGEQTQTITVAATDDAVDDDGESVSLSFVHDPDDRVTTGGGPVTATVALEDDDGPAVVTVSFGAATYTATEGGDAATVGVELDAAPGRAVTVPLTTDPAGGATSADYSGIPATVTFGADQTAQTFSVTATDDTDVDGGESVSIGFGALPAGVFAGRPAAAAVALADGSEQQFLVNFETDSRGKPLYLREGAEARRHAVFLSTGRDAPIWNGKPQRPLTIPLVVTHTGGATEADHAPIAESVTFGVGKGRAYYYVRALTDEEVETGEGLRIDLGPLPPGVTEGYWAPFETIEFVDAAAAAKLSVAGPLLRLGYAGALDGGSRPSPRDFVVSAQAPGGARAMVAVTAVKVRGSDVLLDLDRPVTPDETVTLTYLAAAMHPIRDVAGLRAPPLADKPVRNDTGAAGPLEETAPAGGTAFPAPLAAVLEAVRESAGTERLDLSSRNLTDVSALAGLTGVVELDLSNNRIADLSPLAGLTGLQVLDLRDNQIMDVSPLAALTELRHLDLSGNRIADLWPLAGLTALERLNLADNRVADIATLAGLSGLRVLNLSGNRIEDLWPLAGLAALERLNLSDNRIENLWPLAGLSGLEVLLLDRNRVADVLALSQLAGLANLGLSGNRIADIGLLSELGGLSRLDLSGNAVAEVAALGDLSGLVWLRLSANPVSSAAALVRLESLRWLWLDSGTAAGMEALAPPAGRGAAQLWIERTPVH